MRYEVIVTPEAQAGIEEAFAYIFERSPLNGARWLRGLYRKIDSLESFPERYGWAQEREYLEEDLRVLVFKSHGVIFQVDKASRIVYVLYVRHLRRRPIGMPKSREEEE